MFESAATDPLVQAVEAASRAGIMVVVSAGNVGVNPDDRPGRLRRNPRPRQRAVGVYRRLRENAGHRDPSDELIANYSSRGPSWFDGFAKPDVVAPGQDSSAPAAPGSYLATTYPSLLRHRQSAASATWS